jgi:hypothetical protein
MSGTEKFIFNRRNIRVAVDEWCEEHSHAEAEQKYGDITD